MAEQYKNPYFDSSVFLGWIKNEPNRRAPADHILNLAQSGHMAIYTSTLTLAEVYKMRSGPITPPRENGALFKTFQRYLENDWIRLIDVDRRIGEEANAFCGQFNIFPNDAIHLACALRAGCDFLLAWDNRFSKVRHQSIKCEEPKILGQTRLSL